MCDESVGCSSPKRWKVGGYTLVELTLSVVILGISAVSAIPAFIDIGSVRTGGAVSKVISDLAYVRQLARTRNGTYGISFDAAHNSYTAFSYNPVTGVQTTIIDPTTQSSMVVDFDTLVGMEGVTIQSPNFNNTAKILFSSRGYPQDSSGTDLNVTGSVSLTQGSNTKTIVVQPVTGEVNDQ